MHLFYGGVSIKGFGLALASVVQLVGALTHNPRGVGSNPSQGTFIGHGFNPWFSPYNPQSGHIRSLVWAGKIPDHAHREVTN